MVQQLLSFISDCAVIAGDEDAWTWIASPAGCYTTKSAYSAIFARGCDTAALHSPSEMISRVWKTPAPQKAIITAWRLLKNRLATCDNLEKRKVTLGDDEVRCKFCKSQMDTIDHLFLLCSKIAELWDEIQKWLGFTTVRLNTARRHFETFVDLESGKKNMKFLMMVWVCSIWMLWRRRNECRFDDDDWDCKTVLSDIKLGVTTCCMPIDFHHRRTVPTSDLQRFAANGYGFSLSDWGQHLYGLDSKATPIKTLKSSKSSINLYGRLDSKATPIKTLKSTKSSINLYGNNIYPGLDSKATPIKTLKSTKSSINFYGRLDSKATPIKTLKSSKSSMEKKIYCIFAYAFLITITFPMLSSESKQPMSLATDQTALLSLKHTSLLLATNWTNSTSVCTWIGVTCSLRHHRVAALNLSNMALSATIPPQLGHLSFLVSLDLTNNLFYGDLPQELSLLRRLKFISFQLNNFTGDIPPMLGQLPKLEHLNLRNNSFIGSIPKSLSNLTNLQFLELSSNSLSGEIPKELGRLQSLQALSVQFNRLSGAIPSAIFNISTLVSMAFTYNELSGSLPTDICSNLPSLTGIYLSSNQLSGAIPTNLSQCSRLEVLGLSYNSFSGEIPSEIGFLTSLQDLALGGNNLNGILPHEIGHLQSLVAFGAERNEIAGSIDFNIFINMSSLQTLALGRNKFTGNLSRDVRNITMLTNLDLSENHFTGLIPTEFCQLYHLETLVLNWNSLLSGTYLPLFGNSMSTTANSVAAFLLK
ncbi:leucine-rich repeat receptor-like serine/threonine-protein kinase BAM3 [Salvia miltiorrhiza]|uniref:leucine-rich repeat receptor-like serine/threonine-protein kinase BAM3 n=1 Tax=Salvia miltiorrhiza TaxID=226208 RepID=UPI0025AD284E|nr:leucine-rich repeat receptor-like serine/threonine-protein kinase BAM3 [Salvia miltiorrhiza]